MTPTKITLETTFTPYTLDSYQTFNFENEDESEIYNYNQEHDTDLDYDDFEWEYQTEEYSKALALNLITLLNDNILDDVILKIESDAIVHSPQFYNFDTDKIFLDLTIDEIKLRKYIEKNQEHFDKNKIGSYDGFMWFGDELDTMINYYLHNKTAKDYTTESYLWAQLDQVQAYEYMSMELAKKNNE